MRDTFEIKPEALDIIAQKLKDCLSGDLTVCLDGHDITESVLRAMREKATALSKEQEE